MPLDDDAAGKAVTRREAFHAEHMQDVAREWSTAAGDPPHQILEGKSSGWRFTLHFENIFGEASSRTYTYGGHLEPNGFIGASGAWWLHETGEAGERPAYRAKAKRKGQRRWRWLKFNGDEWIEEGWK